MHVHDCIALCKWINPCGFVQQFTEYLRGFSQSFSKPNSFIDIMS